MLYHGLYGQVINNLPITMYNEYSISESLFR